MEHYAGLFVRETSISTGTGNLTVAAVSTRRRFSDDFGTGATALFNYAIVNEDTPAEYEAGFGYMSDANTLVRVSVLESSNSDALVDFGAGTKSVNCGVIPRWIGGRVDRPRSDILFREHFHRGTPESPITSIPAGWTMYGTAHDYEEWGGSGSFHFQGAGAGMALMRAMPVGMSLIQMGFRVTAANANYVRVRLQVGLVSALKAISATFKAENLFKIEGVDTDFATYDTSVGSDHGRYALSELWHLRLVYNAVDDIDFAFSGDGKTWDTWYTGYATLAAYLGGAPDAMGFSFQSNNYLGGVSVEYFEAR